LPQTKVVKAFNTINANLQVDPMQLAGGNHTLFICGNDKSAKEKLPNSTAGKILLILGI
jgi:predicted dinucleotide-binding enzyme